MLDDVAADAEAVAAKRLQPACASTFSPAQGPCRGVVLMFHGFTAGPWQMAELTPPLCQAGMHVYAPRLPGHGGWDGKQADASLLPKAIAPHTYGEAAEQALVRARALAQAAAVPVFIFGFSLGGAMALDLALRHPEAVQRVVLAAPLLRPHSRPARRLFAGLHLLRFAGAPWLLDRIPFSWGALPEPVSDGWVRPGHWFFRMGHLYAALVYADGVARRAEGGVAMPLQVILTAHDQRCDIEAATQILRASSTPERLLFFERKEQVPHAMLTAQENPHAASRQQIIATTVAFLASLQ